MLDLIIKNGECYINGELKDVDVAIKDGKIQQIGQISDEAKQDLVSVTLLMSLVIIFCKKSFVSAPSIKRIPRSSKIRALLIFIFDYYSFII